VPPCTACYCVSTDIFPYPYISKQSVYLQNSATGVSLCLSSTEVLYSL